MKKTTVHPFNSIPLIDVANELVTVYRTKKNRTIDMKNPEPSVTLEISEKK